MSLSLSISLMPFGGGWQLGEILWAYLPLPYISTSPLCFSYSRRPTIAEQCSSKPPRTLRATSEAGVKVVGVMGCMLLQDEHCMSSRLSEARIVVLIHSAHTNFRQGVVTGRSTMLLQMAH